MPHKMAAARRHSAFGLILTLAMMGALPLAGRAQAQRDAAGDYPNRPLRVITGTPIGSGSDVLMRIVAHQLTASLGRSVVVDNRTGAVGAIALELAAHAVPDGYTLMICSTQNFTAMLLKTVSTNIPATLTPVALLGSTPYLLVTTPSLPVSSVRELRDYARGNKLVYASSGIGSAVHLAMELFKSMAGIDMAHIPYKGSSQSTIDLMSGRVQVALTNTLTATPLVRGGKLKALAVTSATRVAGFPELPTISEAGVKGYESSTWYGLFAPIKTPNAIVLRLNREVLRALAVQDVNEKLVQGGVEPAPPYAPQQFREMVAKEIETWSAVIRKAGIKAE